jgi:hypothetical protein
MKLGFEAEFFLEPRDPSPSDEKQELGDFMDSLIANIMQKEPGTRKVVNEWCLTEDVTIRDEVWDAAKPQHVRLNCWKSASLAGKRIRFGTNRVTISEPIGWNHRRVYSCLVIYT